MVEIKSMHAIACKNCTSGVQARMHAMQNFCQKFSEREREKRLPKDK